MREIEIGVGDPSLRLVSEGKEELFPYTHLASGTRYWHRKPRLGSYTVYRKHGSWKSVYPKDHEDNREVWTTAEEVIRAHKEAGNI